VSDETLDAVVAVTDRGAVSGPLVETLKRVRDRSGLVGFGAVGVVVLAVLYVLSERAFGAAGGAVAAGTAGALASLVAVAYTGWVLYSAHDEYTDRALARDIAERPSLDTVDDATRLLTSSDVETREKAADCIAEVITIGPGKVADVLGVDDETLVAALLPYLRSEHDQVRRRMSTTVPYLARDMPEAVVGYVDTLLDLLEAEDDPDVLGDVALSVGFLVLGTDTDADRAETTATGLVEHDDPDVRIGACYMLAGAGSARARRKLDDVASNDPDPRVRDHAEEL